MKNPRPIIVVFLSLLILSANFGQKNVTVTSVQLEKGGYEFLAQNNLLCAITLRLDFPELHNLEPGEPIPATFVVPAGARDFSLLALSPEQKGAYSYKSAYTYTLGDPKAVPDDYVYYLPFAHGTKHMLTQGNNGSFTHNGDQTFAFDFNLPPGSEVRAARPGIVVDLKSDSNKGGPGPEFEKLANYIIVAHEDGTFGHYVHLRQNGVEVAIGDKVELGQLLGFSGNTGRSTGPHLHFMVTKAFETGRLISIPIYFHDYRGRSFLPLEGDYVYAAFPNMPSFPVLLGTEITNIDYANYKKSLTSGEVGLRAEQVDDTFVLFAQNPSGKTIDLQVNFTLTNMVSTTPLPLTITIPPQTEVFATILRRDKASKTYTYQYNFRFKNKS